MKLVQALLRKTKHCEEIECWSDAIFSYNVSTLTINAVSRQIILAPKVFISCTLNFLHDLTSVYHGLYNRWPV